MGLDSTNGITQQFVGRRPELDVIGRLIPHSVRSGGWMVLITGPAGIGKTRLASEAARLAADEGATVLWGRSSDEAQSTPYWPWVQVIRRLHDHSNADRSGPDSSAGTDLARLVLGGPAEGDRLELFEAAASMIEDRAAIEPLVIVLDDLHLADASSLLLTRFLERRLRESAVLLLTTHRPALGLDPQQGERLTALSEAGIVIELAGLAADDISAALSTALPVDDILAATGGNPLLVQHAINDRGAVGGLDERLGDILGHRIASMPAETRELIAVLGVVGAGWTAERLAALTNAPLAAIESAVEYGRSADLIISVDDTIEVAHALVAQAGLADLDGDQLAQIHRIAAALLSAPQQLNERAEHLLRAGPEAVTEAIDAVRVSAQQALDALAPESTVGLLRSALTALDAHEPTTAATTSVTTDRFDVLILLGDATWRSGQRAEAAEAFEEARRIALELGDDRRIARATLGGGVQYDFHGDRTGEITEQLLDVLTAFDDDRDPLRSRLLAMLAMKVLAIDAARARHIALDALQAAEAAADPVALGHAMIADQITMLGPSTLTRRIESAHHILSIGHEHNHPDLLVQGRFLLLGALLERGDIRALDAELATQERTLEELADETLVRHSLWFRCTRALLRGAIVDGEALAEECFAVAMGLGDPDGIGVYGGQITLIRWMQGRILETEQLYLDLQAEEPDDPLWPAVLGFMWVQDGQLDAARGALDTLPPFDEIEHNQHWLLTLSSIAETAALAGTDEQRRDARDLLLPYADRVVPIAMGAALWGTIARPLGLLARSLGNHDDAIEHLRSAIDIAARLGAWPWLIEAQIDLAVTLHEHRGHSDEVARLIDEARRAAERLELAQFVHRCAMAGISSRPPITGAGAAETTANPQRLALAGDAGEQQLTVTVCGGFDVELPGGTAQWPSRKSRLLFRVLVAQRGQSIHREQLADVLWPDAPGGVSRLDVEVSRLRRALDPDRTSERDEFVVVRDGTVRLQVERFHIDVEQILAAAECVAADAESLPTDQLRALCSRHSGAAFAEDAYDDWAQPVRVATETAICVLFRELAKRQIAEGQLVAATGSLRSLLAIHEFDSAAHESLINTLEASGSHGLAAAAADQYTTAMADLGVNTGTARRVI